MSTILGLDLGKYKSLVGVYDPATTEAHFTTIHTDPADLRKLLEIQLPGRVDFETCTVAGWSLGVGTSDHGCGAQCR